MSKRIRIRLLKKSSKVMIVPPAHVDPSWAEIGPDSVDPGPIATDAEPMLIGFGRVRSAFEQNWKVWAHLARMRSKLMSTGCVPMWVKFGLSAKNFDGPRAGTQFEQARACVDAHV